MIAVVNHSTHVTMRDLQLMVGAVAYQLTHHIAPAWLRVSMVMRIAKDEASVKPGEYPMVLFDTPDAAYALGYHDETPLGNKYGKVFAKPILDAGGGILSGQYSVSATLSHEVAEIFMDPTCNLWADMPDGRDVALELADPVESDSYTQAVTDTGSSSGRTLVDVSNFVCPAWFDDHAPAGSRFDYLGKLKAAFSMTPGGYLIVRGETGNVSQVFGEHYPEWKRAGKGHPAARTARRSAPGIATPAEVPA